MSDILFRHLQVLELKALLDQVANDPILGPQLRERLEDAEQELSKSRKQADSVLPKEIRTLPRFAIFLRGGGVENQTGIRPSLAGAALIQYEKMFAEQAIHDEREFAKTAGRQRRPRGAQTPELLFTGTPRGSFGLEFVPQPIADDALLKVHANSLGRVAEAIIAVANGDDATFATTIEPIPIGVLQPLKQFFKTLANQGAEVRLAFDTAPGTSLGIAQIQRATERLERDVIQGEVEITGIFRGVARESGVFDLKVSPDEFITGTVAENFTEDDLERIDKLTNHTCVAKLQKTTITTISGSLPPGYVLLSAEPSELKPLHITS